jgi:hypothetical protein
MKSETKKRRVERCDQYARNLEMAAFSYDFAAEYEEWRVERCEKQHGFATGKRSDQWNWRAWQSVSL